jgi:hypothetical protein
MTMRETAHAEACALLTGCGMLFTAANALGFEFEKGDLRGSFDTTISVGIQQRLKGQARDNISRDNGGTVPTSGALGERLHGPGGGVASNPDFNFINGDDGNLNYNKGDITALPFKGTHDLGMRWGDGWRFLGRATWLLDYVVEDTRSLPLADDAKRLAGRDIRLLDFWVSKDFKLGTQPWSVKLGNQVVSWGEDIFIVGGLNSINALDLRRFRVPGTQLKEVFRPAPMLYFNGGLTDTVNLEGFYQFRWNGFLFDPVGTFFSTADIVGKGQRTAFIPSSLLGLPPGTVGDRGALIAPGVNVIPIDRADVEPPSNRHQYGLAMRLKPKTWDAELGFYYLRYHDKIPFTSLVYDPLYQGGSGNVLGLGYFNEYGKNKNMFGVSMNTKIGPVAVGAELSYRPRESVGIDPGVPTPTNFAVGFTGLPPGAKAMGYSVLDAVAACGLGTGDVITPGPNKTTDPANCRTVVRGYVEEKKWQAHLTGFYFIEVNSLLGRVMRGLGAAEGYILAEAAVTRFPNLDTANIPYLIFPSYALPTKTSWGYVIELAMTYPQLIGSVNVTPQIDFTHDVQGISPNALPFVEGRKSIFFGLNFDRRSTWRGQVGVSHFWGGGLSNPFRDRSFVGASISYSF